MGASKFVVEVSTFIAGAQSVGKGREVCLELITFREPATESEVLDCLRTFVLATFPSTYLEAQLVRVDSNHPNWILEDMINDPILEQIDRILAAQKQTK